MDARSIIARLRRREVPDVAELRWFAQGLADGTVSDAQAVAGLELQNNLSVS